MTYATFEAKLAGRNYDSRKLENNTYLVRRPNGIAIKLHGTDIITYHENGNLTIRTGGYDTLTTRARLHRYTPSNYRVFREGGQSYIQVNGKRLPLRDGMTFGPRGGLLPCLPA